MNRVQKDGFICEKNSKSDHRKNYESSPVSTCIVNEIIAWFKNGGKERQQLIKFMVGNGLGFFCIYFTLFSETYAFWLINRIKFKRLILNPLKRFSYFRKLF